MVSETYTKWLLNNGEICIFNSFAKDNISLKGCCQHSFSFKGLQRFLLLEFGKKTVFS